MQTGTLIRPATISDEPAVAELAVGNDMFTAEEVGELTASFRDTVAGGPGGHRWWIATTASGDVAGAAYVAPEPFADRVWNVYFLAVSPTLHGGGTGTQLMEHVEHELGRAGQDLARVLLVETSNSEQYAGARGFYRARGFDEEALIREFYGPGDDKVVFWKRVTS
jgi:ribosomal protein S18 acetylase RimI-like enzyme